MRQGTAVRPAIRTDKESFPQDHFEYPPAVFGGTEVADTVDAGVLVAGDLGNDKAGCGGADVDQRLDLEAVAVKPPIAFERRWRSGVEAENWDVLPPNTLKP